mmetsp:Transcript_96814/g.269208  ORF Transcript_96814/g.269208 Transcript_96814/m.269208 type:complete len:216 (+) Transcript_96814:276-923(+)
MLQNAAQARRAARRRCPGTTRARPRTPSSRRRTPSSRSCGARPPRGRATSRGVTGPSATGGTTARCTSRGTTRSRAAASPRAWRFGSCRTRRTPAPGSAARAGSSGAVPWRRPGCCASAGGSSSGAMARAAAASWSSARAAAWRGSPRRRSQMPGPRCCSQTKTRPCSPTCATTSRTTRATSGRRSGWPVWRGRNCWTEPPRRRWRRWTCSWART